MGFVLSAMISDACMGTVLPTVVDEAECVGDSRSVPGVVYLVLRGGKLLFGRQRIRLPQDSRVVFTETAMVLPDGQQLEL
jgi:hypothetical protein